MLYKLLVVFCLFFSVSYANWTKYELTGSSSSRMGNLHIKQDSLGNVFVVWGNQSLAKVFYWDKNSWNITLLCDNKANVLIEYLNVNIENRAIVCWTEKDNDCKNLENSLKVAIGNGKNWTITNLSDIGKYIRKSKILVGANDLNRFLVGWVEEDVISHNWNVKVSMWKEETMDWTTSILEQDMDVIGIKDFEIVLNENNNAVISWVSQSPSFYKVKCAIWAE